MPVRAGAVRLGALPGADLQRDAPRVGQRQEGAARTALGLASDARRCRIGQRFKLSVGSPHIKMGQVESLRMPF